MLKIRPVKTEIFHRGNNLVDFLLKHLDGEDFSSPKILVIASKIISLAENRCVSKDLFSSKEDLVRSEAQHYFGKAGFGVSLSKHHGHLVASAGIDESNSEEGLYILYPKDPFESAQVLGRSLRDKWSTQKLGVLIVDSHTRPFRRGVMGLALGYWGFSGIKDEIGKNDLFGRPLKMTQVNVADALAVSSVLCMGESAERTPLALLDPPAWVSFDSRPSQSYREELSLSSDEDIYTPLIRDRI